LETPDEPEPPRERVEVTMAAKKKRQRYTKEQREAVLADVPTIGVSATARKHGVPQTSVSGWLRARSREGLTVAAVRRKTPPTPVAPTPRETPTATRTPSSRVAKTYTPSQGPRARRCGQGRRDRGGEEARHGLDRRGHEALSRSLG
jgi:transposase-like protein